uniref:PGPS/D3 n=1 Tax=Solanum tuberosum TaxID=4113 RepID=M1CWZ6_SOLTU
MGACASVPKDIKADAAAAPLPEQPKEEETTTTTEVTAVDKQIDGEMKVEDEKLAGDSGSLLTESETANESLVKDEKSSETTDEKPEEAKVSDETDAKQPAAAEEKSV